MSNKINTFKNAISKYIEIDQEITKIEKINDSYITKLKDKLKEIENPVKELKSKKNTLLEYITHTMENSSIKDKSFKIKVRDSSYIIRCDKSEKKDSFTQKYIKEALINYYKEHNYNKLTPVQCEQKALDLFKYLLNSRNTKEVLSLVYDSDK